MAAFKFRMDFLIRARQRKEEEAMARLAQRLASITDLERDIAEQEQYKTRLKDELAGKIKTGGVSIPLLSMYREYDHKLSRDISRLNEFLRLSRREEAKERAALIKASVDRKVMEKLKEKKKLEFTAEQMYLEQNNLEEMAALAKARRDREEHKQALEEAWRFSLPSGDRFQADRPLTLAGPLLDED